MAMMHIDEDVMFVAMDARRTSAFKIKPMMQLVHKTGPSITKEVVANWRSLM